MSSRTLWIGGYGPPDSAHGQGLAAFADHVSTASQGEVVVEITWNIMEEGRPNTDLFDLVEAGRMFFCYFSTSYLGERVGELNVLETPFLFPDLDTAHRSLDGALGLRLRTAVREQTPMLALGFWDNGFRQMTNRLRPILAPHDLGGMTVRLQPNPIHEELIRSWGGIPVSVELSEAIRLILAGSVDAQENPLANTIAYGVDKLHPYVTMTGHLYGARGLFASRRLYESLPADIRQIVDEGIRSAISVQREAAEALEKTYRQRMEAGGIEFIDLTPEQKQAFVEASAPAIEMARSSVKDDLFELVET